ncbi:conserved hypothetical protein [Talaromyces stipitatus ATCC 10500]|uniref:Uncharacterized protein n=1 Tax=Talaromyces stipitatus (strain ATCC 10500 / CBS 375.48 / QM 6759 / NRRL 1006) TaxID=441959 RepID=B8LZN2_TALSN|nr:uncharacterized protein TSTA_097040 [Talaromyces stipitatus ATCC 10500]EED22455.1 conserved hypothetical protein [Talaromyces stipitatus ATCC 10500]
MATDILYRTTTGALNVWGGTKDGKDGYIHTLAVDYKNRSSNLIPPYEIKIKAHDIRQSQPRPTFKETGFELTSHITTMTPKDFLAHETPEGKDRLNNVYFEECRRLVMEITGCATAVYTSYRVRDDFDTSVRAVPKMDQKTKVKADGPRPLAHVDRDYTTALHALKLAVGEERAEGLVNSSKRWAQVNVWRPFGNVCQRWPLAFLMHGDIPDWDYDKYCGRIYNFNDPRVESRGEKSYDTLLKEDPRYVYYYASNQMPDEAWVFSAFDSNPSMCIPHSAFWDDNTPLDAPPRATIEVRFMAFWPKEEAEQYGQ